jgi:hypothetical protein
VSDFLILSCKASTGARTTLRSSFSADGKATNEELGGEIGRWGVDFLVTGDALRDLANRGTGIDIGVDASEIIIFGFRRKVRAACVACASLLFAAIADLRFGSSNEASISEVSGSVSFASSKVTLDSSRDEESRMLGVVWDCAAVNWRRLAAPVRLLSARLGSGLEGCLKRVSKSFFCGLFRGEGGYSMLALLVSRACF